MLATILSIFSLLHFDPVHFYQRVSIASYASAGIARAEMSVRPSVRHTPVLYQNEESERHDFFTIREPEHSSF